MKAILINFFLLTALLSLMSCSAGKQDVSLKVSAGFAIGSAGYTGGLVVTGKNTNGKKFTATAIGGTQLDVLLENGSWTINVAGWDGAANFAGDVYCGKTTAQLDSDTKIVDITVKKENCNSNEFHGGNTALYNEATNTYRPMNVYNCGALYIYSSGNYVPVDATTSYGEFSSGFCAGTNLPQGLREKAKSGRILIEGLNATNRLSGPCINSNAAGMMFNARIPAAGIPVKIELYEESDCQDKRLEYNFANGISAGATDFDSVINNNASSYYSVFLPFNHLRKGYSALMNILPEMKCVGAYCLPEPALPADYSVFSNSGYRDIKLDIPTCQYRTFTGPNLSFPTTNFCEERDDGVFLKVQTTAACQSTACVLTITDNSTPTATTMTKTISSNNDIGNEKRLYDQVWRMFGTESTNLFFESSNHNDHNAGTISRAQEEMGPGGAVSLFGKVACADLNGIKEIELFDEGAWRKYQVQASPSTEPIPKLICHATDGNIQACAGGRTTFDKQIVLRGLEGPQWVTREVMHIRCDAKIGLAESQHEKVDEKGPRSEKNLIGWNTESPGYERVEKLDYDLRMNGTLIEEVRTSFERAELRSGEYRGVGYYFESHNNTGGLQERLSQSDFFSSLSQSQVTHHSKDYEFLSPTMGAIFDQPVFSQEMNRPFFSHDSFIARSPDGTKVVRTWIQFETVNPKVYLSSYDSLTNTWTHPTLLNSDSVSNTNAAGYINSMPRAAVNNAGQIVVAWKEVYSGVNQIVSRKGYIGSMGSPDVVSFGLDVIGTLDVCMNETTSTSNTKAAIVWDQVSSGFRRINAAFATSMGIDFTKPTSSADFISDSAVSISTLPKCVITSNDDLLVGYINAGNQIKFTNGTISIDMTTLVTEAASNQFTDVSFIANEVYLEKNGAYVYATMPNRSNTTTSVRKANVADLMTWINPAGGTALFPFKSYPDGVTAKDTTLGIGTTPVTPTAAPNSLLVPSYNSIVKGNQFGLRELKPSNVLGKFTPYANFVSK